MCVCVKAAELNACCKLFTNMKAHVQAALLEEVLCALQKHSLKRCPCVPEQFTSNEHTWANIADQG